ncbi:MAG: M48 family metallopeptidase [Acidobacteriota bacterium]|nr:MAG: M48 family metallopeptidase [Acidobacteriota bacterium]
MKKIVMSTLLSTIVLSLVLLPLPTADAKSAKTKELKIKGYITQVNSPTSFEIDEYKISMDGKHDVELQNIEDEAIKFDPRVHLRVGTLVKMKCEVNTETLEARVKEIKIDVKQFRRLSHTTVLDTYPSDLEMDSEGKWSGEVLADARRIKITPETDVRFKLNKSEEREEKERKEEEEEAKEIAEEQEKIREQREKKEDALENQVDDDEDIAETSVEVLQVGASRLTSLSDIGPGVYMTYKGKEDLIGNVVASDVVFVKNEKTKKEQDLWKKLRIKEKESKKANSFDTLKVGGEKFKVLPDEEIQEYVNDLGRSLVPEYQRELPDDDENKIPFRFVVIHEKYINAGAFPTGTVVINHDVFNFFENEAQLAFLLSHEIAHATQEHQIRQLNHKKKTRTWLKIGAIASYAMGYGLLARTFAMTEAAMRNGYARSIENQSDRIGMANMIQSGYDPREAPRVWKISSWYFGDKGTNFFWSSHSSNTERRSYMMVTLRNSYPGLDYSSLKKDSIEYQRIAALVKEKYPTKLKTKKGRLP